MAVTKFASVRRAIVDFLRASPSLVSLVGHTSADPRIAGAVAEDKLTAEGLYIFTRPSRPLFDECDYGPWNTGVNVVIRHKDEATVYSILGTLQEYVRQNQTTYDDAAYDLHAGVRLESIRWSADLSNAPEVQQEESGVFWTEAFLVVRWREK